MHLGGGVHGIPPPVGEAVGAHRGTDARGAGHGEADEVGLRGAAHEEAARVGGIARRLGAPPHDLLLHEDRGVVGAAHVGVEDARQQVREVADGVARTHVPAPEPRVVVPHRVGHDLRQEVGVCRAGTFGRAGERSVEEAPDLVGHRLPDGLVAAAREVVEGVVDHPVGQGTQGVPVRGVEAGAAVRRGVGVGEGEGRRRHLAMLSPGSDG